MFVLNSLYFEWCMCTRAANAQDINMIMFEFMCDINFVYISVEHVLQNVISRESVRSSSRNELQVHRVGLSTSAHARTLSSTLSY